MLRTVCACAIVCACSAIALTWIWCDLLQVILPTQMQLWRWVWMTSVLAVLLSPVIVKDCWKSGSAMQRAALIFIGSALLLRADSGAPVALVLAVTSAGLARRHAQFRYGHYILFGALALLVFALGLGIADGLPTALFLACALVAVWVLAEWFQRFPVERFPHWWPQPPWHAWRSHPARSDPGRACISHPHCRRRFAKWRSNCLHTLKFSGSNPLSASGICWIGPAIYRLHRWPDSSSPVPPQ